MVKERISLRGVDPLLLFGRLDELRKLLVQQYGVDIILRGNTIILQGNSEKTLRLKLKILSLIEEIKAGKLIDKESITQVNGITILTTPKGLVKPRSPGQIKYLNALEKFDIVICIGPAGTGKTYLAVAKAVESLKEGIVHRIILTRPAVEAGERLGFLPGDFKEKVDPYLRPLYDALYELMLYDKIKQYIEERKIEIAPLAYMRGRNLDNSFVILDEAQNTGKIQMKMFLTRMGLNSKLCIIGDITQIDLPNPKESGLLHVKHLLREVRGIRFVELTGVDIVRHPLVKEIVEAYETEKNTC